MAATVLAAASIAIVLSLGLNYLLWPLKKIRGIPTISFWVALLPLFKDVDQQEIFKKYIDEPLRKHGVVKIFFAAQWNLLVHRPEYMAEIFKREDIYQKSGNFKKIPNSVLATLLGDNVISSHGETWKLYTQLIKPGLQMSPDFGILIANARRLCSVFLDLQARATTRDVGVQESIQRYTIANFGQLQYNVDFDTLHSEDAYLHRIQYQMKREIFKPIFMNFPFLDNLPFPSRQRARQLASHFTDQLVLALENGHKCNKSEKDRQSQLPKILLEARNSGVLTEKQFRDNVTILFVAGQENPQLAIISTLYLLAKHPDVQEQLFNELTHAPVEEINQEYLQGLPLLTSTIYECLRLFPPIGQLINRRVSTTVNLGGEILIPAGTYVGYNCYSTNRDPVAWGEDAEKFRPRRWGQSCVDIQKEYRWRRARAEFISFHGGQRACLGERFAILQLKATLYVLVTSLRWRLDPTWRDRMTPAGPLYPRNLRLIFEERATTNPIPVQNVFQLA